MFGNDTLISPSGLSCFCIVKYDPNGNVLWAKQAKVLDNNNWNIWSLSIDNSKHLYFSANGGYQQCKIAFGGNTLSMNDTAAYDGASIVFRLDSNGNTLCSAIVPTGTIGGGFASVIASDTWGNYVYLGATAGTIAIFGKDTVNPFSVPTNPIQTQNYFPFAARWEECDTNVIHAGVQNQKSSIESVRIYPNPSNGMFTIALQNVNEPVQVEVYNMLGEKIHNETLNLFQGLNTIDINNQPNGVYFYRVLTENESLVESGKLVIQR